MTERQKTLQIEIGDIIDKLNNGLIHPLTAKTMLYESANKPLKTPFVGECSASEDVNPK